MDLNEISLKLQAGKAKDVKLLVMIGGAPVNEGFCEQIGADAYMPDAATAAEVAVGFCA